MEVFEEARKELYFPPIRLKLEDGSKIRLNFAGKYRKPEVVAGRKVFLNHSRVALKGLFKLALARWIKHPYSLKMSILEEYWLKDYDKRNRIRELFDTVVCSIYLLKKGHREVLRALEEVCSDEADEAILKFLKTKFLGLRADDLTRSLLEIDFESQKAVKTSIKKFAEVISPLIKSKEEEVFELNISSINKALSEVAGEVGIKEFREISEYFGIGKGIGESKLADINWYIKRSARYSIKITDRVSSGDYPFQIVDFSPDDGIDYYSPIESLGKVLPGLAKMYALEGFEGHSSKKRNAVIIIDSSGSMKRPESGSHAIIGAFAIAKSYMDGGGKVGVINFSGKTELLKPSRGIAVYKAIAEYQGGGTELNTKKVIEYVKSFAMGYDIILITDAGIDNLSEVEEMLRELRELGCNNYVIWIKSGFKDYKKLSLYAKLFEVEREEDIPKIRVRS